MSNAKSHINFAHMIVFQSCALTSVATY